MFECRVCINYVHVTHYGEVTSDHAPITSPPPRSNCQILVKVKFVWGGECNRLSGHLSPKPPILGIFKAVNLWTKLFEKTTLFVHFKAPLYYLFY